jgi:hypothetical protein
MRRFLPWSCGALALAVFLGAACRSERAAPPGEPEIPVRATVFLHPQIKLDRDRAELEDRVATAAVRWIREQATPRLEVDPDRPLEIGIRVDLSEDLTRLVIDEQLHLRHARNWPLEVTRRRELPIGPQGIDMAGALTAGVRSALGLLADMADVFRLDDAGLLAIVKRSEAADDLRSLAVRILQERQSRAAVGELLALFPTAPSALRLTILDAAATLAGPEELQVLLGEVDGRRFDEVTRALRAATLVGGRDAREFAGWMAVGHPDKRVRQSALEAYLQITESMPPDDVVQLGLADVR